MTKPALFCLLFFSLSCMVFGEGFYIDGGISLNTSNYGTQMDAFIDNYFDLFGLNRVVFGGSLTGGYRLMPGLFVTGTFIYTRDMIRGFGYELNVYSPSLLAGLRWYPMESRKYLQLGLDAGPAWLIFNNNIPGIPNESGIGLGVNFSIAIDFCPSESGSHFQFCGNVFYAYINGGSVFTPGVSLKLGYKKAKNAANSNDNLNDASLAAGIVWPVLAVLATWIGFNMIPSNGRS